MLILVAEDDPVSRRLVCYSLEKLGYTPLSCENGQIAWERYKEHLPLICIIDWIMPDMNGIELCRRISTWNGQHSCQKIMLTVKDEKEDLIEAMNAGANDYLFKPVDINYLQLRLKVAELKLKGFPTAFGA